MTKIAPSDPSWRLMTRSFRSLTVAVDVSTFIARREKDGFQHTRRFHTLSEGAGASTVVARASRPCESCNRHTGGTPVPLPSESQSPKVSGSPHTRRHGGRVQRRSFCDFVLLASS